MKKRLKQVGRTAFLLIMVVCLMSVELSPAMAWVTQADIDALKGDASELSQQKKELEAELERLRALAGETAGESAVAEEVTETV